MIGFDSPEVQVQIAIDMEAAVRAFAEAAEAMIPIAQQVWAAITKIVHDFLDTFHRWFSALPSAVRRAFVGRSETIMRKKMRCYALSCAQRR